MLTEARIDADQIRDLVFGLGLNLNSPAGSWPPDLARHAVSLAEQTAGPLDPNHFTAALIGRVLLAYTQFLDGDHLETFADRWNRLDLLRGQPVVVLQGGKRFAGIAAGVDDSGSLLVRSAGSRRPQRFLAGEVTLGKSA
jgi:BirA family biotin operon repressor/biotin-[acetyl-CoA-carboxylase] ligase